MTFFTDAYMMTMLPRSTRRVLSPGGQQFAVTISQDGLDLSLAALVYKAIDAAEGLVDMLRGWHEKRVTIRRLTELDSHLLKDIGLHRGDVLAMAGGLVNLEDIVQNRRMDTTSVANRKQSIRHTHEIVANDNELADAA